MRKSARDFDEGDVSEAARLALAIRVLVHPGQSASLLTQLHVQRKMRFLDSRSPPPVPSTPGAIVKRFDVGLCGIQGNTDIGGSFWVPLDDIPGDAYGWQPFKRWWHRQVLEDLHGSVFTRAELVLFVANKAGGAHVDSTLQSRFAMLTKYNATGWGWTRSNDDAGLTLVVPAGPEDIPLGNPIPPNIRQIAHELDRACNEQLGTLLVGN